MDRYVVVIADDPQEAVSKSPFFIGQSAKVERIQVSANLDGTYSVFAEFELLEPKGEKNDDQR